MDERFGVCNSTSVMKLLCGVMAVKDRTLPDLPRLCKFYIAECTVIVNIRVLTKSS